MTADDTEHPEDGNRDGSDNDDDGEIDHEPAAERQRLDEGGGSEEIVTMPDGEDEPDEPANLKQHVCFKVLHRALGRIKPMLDSRIGAGQCWGQIRRPLPCTHKSHRWMQDILSRALPQPC